SELIEKDSSNSDLWYLRGFCHFTQGYIPKAYSDLFHYAQLRPKDVEGIHLLAQTYHRLDSFERAATLYRSLISTANTPDQSVSIQLRAAESHHRAGRHTEALNMLETARLHGIRLVEIEYHIGRYLMAVEGFTAAILHLRTAESIYEKNEHLDIGDIYINLALAYRSTGQEEKATKYAHKWQRYIRRNL
ncbi:MAG: hypothetical protein AAF570_26790, partial [Bacteroidota bacterium]